MLGKHNIYHVKNLKQSNDVMLWYIVHMYKEFSQDDQYKYCSAYILPPPPPPPYM